MDPTTIGTWADTLTSAPEWQQADAAARARMIRSYSISQRTNNPDPAAHAALVQELWTRNEPGWVRSTAGFVGNAVKEVAASFPASGAAIVLAGTDAAGLTDTGSGGRLMQGVKTLADGTLQRIKSFDPNDLQENRDGGLELLKQDIDQRTYPAGVEAWLSGEAEDKLDKPAQEYVRQLTDGLATAAVRADHGAEAPPDRFAAYKQSGRYLGNRQGENGPPAREFLADYIATGEPSSWEAFASKVKQTDAQWKAEVRNAPKLQEARKIAGKDPGLLDSLALRGMDMQGSPIDLATAVIPLLRGTKALKAARTGAAGFGKELVKGATMEGLQESGTTFLQDPNASNAQVFQDGLSGAIGAGVVETGGHLMGKAVNAMRDRNAPGQAPGVVESSPPQDSTTAAPGPDASLFPAPADVGGAGNPAAFDPTLPGDNPGPVAPLIDGALPPESSGPAVKESLTAGPPLTPATATDPQGTIPETPETLLEQRRRVVSGQRPAMLFPGIDPEQVPAEYQPGQDEGVLLTATPAGTFLHGFDVSSAEIQQAVEEGRTGHLLGMATPSKPDGASAAIVQRTAAGTEVTAAAVTPDTAQATVEMLRNNSSPGDTITVETPEQVLQQRLDPTVVFPANTTQGQAQAQAPMVDAPAGVLEFAFRQALARQQSLGPAPAPAASAAVTPAALEEAYRQAVGLPAPAPAMPQTAPAMPQSAPAMPQTAPAMPQTAPAGGPDNVSTSQRAEQWADRKIADSRGKLLSGVPDPELLAAYAVKGSLLIARGVRDLAAWTAEMVREFGEAIRPHLTQVYEQATTGAVGRSMVLGARPGEYGWKPSGIAATEQEQRALTAELADLNKDPDQNGERIQEIEAELRGIASKTLPGPVTHPTQAKPRLERIGVAAGKILKSAKVGQLLSDLYGITGLEVQPITGTWEGNREPSFVVRSATMTDEQAARAGALFGFAWAQDATVVSRPNPSLTEGIPSYFIGSGKRLSEKQVNAIHQAARQRGLDFSTTPDGKSAQFLYFGGEADLPAFTQSIADIQRLAGLTESHHELVSSDLNETQTNFSGSNGSSRKAAWLQATAEGQSLFERIVRDLVAPYAKAIGAEGYRFNVDLYAQRFGLTPAQRDIVADALYPTNGKLKSAVPIMEGKVDLGVEGVTTKKGRFVASVTNVVWSLQNWSAQRGLIAPDDYSPKAGKLIAQTIADEVAWHVRKAAESGKRSAIGWYDRALKAAKAIYSSMFSELDVNGAEYDPDKAMIFDAILGIASQGNNVTDNSVMAVRVYANWRKGGKTITEAVQPVTGTFGAKTVAIENNYLKLETLLKNNSYADLRKFLNKTDTVGNINAYLRKNKNLWFQGKALSVEGAAAQTVTGWMVFGPKIGSFINNLHGDYSTLTADLWFSRTWNRILGWSFIHSPALEAQQYIGLRDAMVAEYTNDKSVRKMEKGKPIYWDHGTDVTKLNLSPEEFDQFINDPQRMLDFATGVEKVFRTGYREGQKKTTSYKDKSAVRRAAKTWIENRENVMEAPRSDHERMFQQDVMEKAQRMLKRMGIDINIADMQAALWYNEKDLYATLGSTTKLSAPADYEDAAKTTFARIQNGTLYERIGKEKDDAGETATPRIQPREWEAEIFSGLDAAVAAEVAQAEAEAPLTPAQRAEQWADKTIQEGKGKMLSGVPDPALITAYAVKGSLILARGIRDFTQWSAIMLREFGESVRPHLNKIFAQATTAVDSPLTDSTIPATPDGPPINIFGQRVEADARLRESWRARFTPAEYSPFTEEELARQVRDWIGREGGLEGAARLFLDPTAGLRDYERNALGQQLAIGLDLRARRAENAGNAPAVHQAEAMLDDVVAQLETLATQAGQALRAFGLWAKFSPRGIIRQIQRQTDRVRTEHVQTTLATTPAAVVQATKEAAAEAKAEADKERAARTPDAATNWIAKLARSQSDTLSWGTASTLSALERLIRAHMKDINPAFAAQAAALGVPDYEAGVLDRLVLEEHRRSAAMAKDLAILKLTEKLTKPKVTRKSAAKIPPMAKALMEGHAAGALTDRWFLDAYATAFGLPKFTPEFAARIRTLADRVNAAPQGSWLRNLAQRNLLAALSHHESIPVGQMLTAYWYANILSGIGTQLVNVSGNATQLLGKTLQVVLTNNPTHTAQFIRGMVAGAAEGAKQGWEAFSKGIPVMKGETEWQRHDVLEMLWSENPRNFKEKLARIGAASWGRYVFRSLTAMDSFFFNTAKEGRAWLETSRALAKGGNLKSALGFDAATWTAAMDQAKLDLQSAGTSTPTARQIDRRAFEIVEGKRSAEVLATARRFGGEATYNYVPEGTMGGLAEVANLMVRRFPVARMVIPFVNIVANVADQALDYTPVGAVRAFKGGHLLNQQGPGLTRQQRAEKMAASVIGITGAGLLYLLAKGNEDQDDERVPFMVYGQGPTDKAKRDQMPRGWRPFTIKIGSAYISYAETPLGLILSAVGTSMDRRRYGGRKDSDEPWQRAQAILAGGGAALMKTGVLSSMDKLFGMLDGTAKPNSIAYRTAAGLIPAQGLLRNIAQAIDPTKIDTGSFNATMLANLPVLKSQGQPAINLFGEPVREPGPWVINRLITQQDRSDPEASWLARNRLSISGIDNEVALSQYLDDTPNELRATAAAAGLKGLAADRYVRAAALERITNGYLTDDQRTALIRSAGPGTRNAVRKLRREIETGQYQPASPAALQRRLSDYVTTVRRIARIQLVK